MTRVGAARAVTIVVTLAIGAAACSSPPREDAWAVPDVAELPDLNAAPTEDNANPTSEDLTAAVPDPDAQSEPTLAPTIDVGAPVEVIEDDCYGDGLHCRRLLVPQTSGSLDLVEVGYTIYSDSGTETPVVVLSHPRMPLTIDADTFPNRPVVVVGSREEWPGGPGLSCPEWAELPTVASPESITTTTETCRDRLSAAGLDVDGSTSAALANEAAVVIASLGYESVDIVALGWRASLVGTIAAAVEVRSAVYVQPDFSDLNLATERAKATLASLESLYGFCDRADQCNAPGSVGDLLDAATALDTAPINNTDPDQPPINGQQIIAAVNQLLVDPNGARAVPDLHQALVNGDAATASAYVNRTFSNSSADGLARACATPPPTDNDLGELPALLQQQAGRTRDFLAAACPVWGAATDDETRPAPPGLVVISESSVDPTALASELLITEPTIGPPTTECATEAALLYFDTTEVGRGLCDAEFVFRDSSSFELVEGRYEFDETLTIQTMVPDTWSDYGDGTWWRDATLLDETSLDLYVWVSESTADARLEMAESWRVEEAELDAIELGEIEWLMATGVDSESASFGYSIAVAEIDNEFIGLVLGADLDELTELTDAVLIPAMRDATVRRE